MLIKQFIISSRFIICLSSLWELLYNRPFYKTAYLNCKLFSISIVILEKLQALTTKTRNTM